MFTCLHCVQVVAIWPGFLSQRNAVFERRKMREEKSTRRPQRGNCHLHKVKCMAMGYGWLKFIYVLLCFCTPHLAKDDETMCVFPTCGSRLIVPLFSEAALPLGALACFLCLRRCLHLKTEYQTETHTHTLTLKQCSVKPKRTMRPEIKAKGLYKHIKLFCKKN